MLQFPLVEVNKISKVYHHSPSCEVKTFSNVEADMALLEQSSSNAQKAVVQIAVDFQNAQRRISDGVSNLLDSDFGADIAELITLPTKIMATVTEAIPGAQTRPAPTITPPGTTPTPTELEMDAGITTGPNLTGQQLTSAFGLGDVIQSQSNNTSLTVDAIKSLESVFKRQMSDLAAAVDRI